MRAIRVLSVMLICIGCVIAFVGAAAIVLPMIQNDQLRLVLSSFEMPSQNVIVNMMNSAMTFALGNCYLVLGIGAGLAVIGVLMQSFTPHNKYNAANRRWESAAAPRNTFGMNVVPQWRTSKAEKVEARNPFAAAIASDAAPYRPAQGTTFAPAVQGQAAAAKPYEGRAEATFYARPAADEAAKSPYARPKTSAVEEVFRPAYSEKPTVKTAYTPILPIDETIVETASAHMSVQPSQTAAPDSPPMAAPVATTAPAPVTSPVSVEQTTPAVVSAAPAAPVAAPSPVPAEPAAPVTSTPPPAAPAPVHFTLPSARKADGSSSADGTIAEPSSKSAAAKAKPTIVMKGFPPPAADAAPRSAPVPPPAAAPADGAPTTPAKAAKPRIKSTMGKHS